MSADPLLLRNASLLDLGTGALSESDVLLEGGRVARLGPALAVPEQARIVDLAGCYVVPGYVDIHAHVFEGVGDSVSADRACLDRGTVTVVDGGSAGAFTIDAFRRVAEGCRTEILAWLNLSTIGLADTSVGELIMGPYLNPEAAVDAVRRHQGFVVGIKARLSTYACGRGARRVMAALLDVAKEVALPVMVHVGDTDEPLDELVALLRPGDVVTHALTGRKHGILDAKGHLRPGIREAQAAGIVFDAARGRNHLSFAVLAQAIDQGFVPDTVSTDMTDALVGQTDYGLSTLGTYLLAYGVSLPQTLSRMTTRPAKVIGRQVSEIVCPGQAADLTIVALDHRPARLDDVDGGELRVSQQLAAVGTVRAGVYAPTGGIGT